MSCVSVLAPSPPLTCDPFTTVFWGSPTAGPWSPKLEVPQDHAAALRLDAAAAPFVYEEKLGNRVDELLLHFHGRLQTERPTAYKAWEPPRLMILEAIFWRASQTTVRDGLCDFQE